MSISISKINNISKSEETPLIKGSTESESLPIEISTTKNVEKRKTELCKELCITPEELEKYIKLYPDFMDKKIDEQREIVEKDIKKSDAPNKKASASKVVKPKIHFPDNWKQMSAKEQQDFLFEEMGKNKYSDWDKKTSEEKAQLKRAGIEELCQLVDSQYEYMSEKDKSKAQDLAKIVIGAVIDHVDIKKIENGELNIDPVAIYQALKTEDQRKVGTILKEKASELGIVISKNDQIRHEDNEAIRTYFNIDKNTYVSDAQRLEYYRHLEETHVNLNEYQKNELKVLAEIEKIDSNQLKGSRTKQTGTTTIKESFGKFISDQEQFITADNGSLSLQRGADTNRSLLLKALKNKYANISSLADDSPELKQIQDEFSQDYFNLSSYEQKILLNTILRDNNNSIDKRLLAGINRNSSSMIVLASNDEKVSTENQKYAMQSHNDSLKARKADGEEIDVSGYTKYVAQSENFNSEVKATVGLGMAELGEKETDIFLKSEKEYDKNYMETFKYTNKYINDSDTVTDSMKEYYASKSIEILDNPAERSAQAENLSSYNSESFNKGIETGYENAARNDYISNYSNETIKEQPILTNYNLQQEQTYYGDSPNYLTKGQIIEQLSNMTHQEKEAYAKEYNLPPSICNELPELIEYYVNKGDGMYVVENCSVPIGNTAIRFMLKNPEDRKKLAALQPGRLSKVTYDIVHKDDSTQSNQGPFMYKA